MVIYGAMRPHLKSISMPFSIWCLIIKGILSHISMTQGGTWAPSIRRNLNDWEIKETSRLLGVLGGLTLNHREKDKWV